MVFPTDPAQVYRDFVTDGVPASGANSPKKAEIRRMIAERDAALNAGLSNGGLIYVTKANLDADIAHGVNASAWVIGDSAVANNGIYRKSGASGSGSWSRVGDLPYSFVRANNAGAGTANAIVATTSIPLPAAAYGALILMNVFVANTGPVTVAVNGGAAKPLVTSSGNALAAGYLTTGALVAFVDGGTNFRLLTDVASSAIQAAAEVAASAAKADADRAEASAGAAAGVMTTVIDPQFSTKAVAELFRPVVAPDYIRTAGYASAGDGGGALYKKVAVQPTHAGKLSITLLGGAVVWYELADEVLDARSLGAKGDGTDSLEALQRAIGAASTLQRKLMVIGDFTVSGTLSLVSPAQIEFIGKMTTSAATGPFLDITTSDASISGVRLSHVNNNANQVYGIQATGVAGALLSNISIKNCRFTRIGWHGISLNYVQDSIVDDIGADNINNGLDAPMFGSPTVVDSRRVTVSNIRMVNSNGKTCSFSFSENCTANNIISIAGSAANSNEAFYTNGSYRVHATNIVGIGKTNYGVKFSRDSRECSVTNAHLEGGSAGLYFEGSSDCRAQNCRLIGIGSGYGLQMNSHAVTSTAANRNLVVGCHVLSDTASTVCRVTTDVSHTSDVSKDNRIESCTFESAIGKRCFENLLANRTSIINCSGVAAADVGVSLGGTGADAYISGCDFKGSSNGLNLAQPGARVTASRFVSTGAAGLALTSTASGVRISGCELIGTTASVSYSRNNADVRVEYCRLPNGESGTSTSVTKSYNVMT